MDKKGNYCVGWHWQVNGGDLRGNRKPSLLESLGGIYIRKKMKMVTSV